MTIEPEPGPSPAEEYEGLTAGLAGLSGLVAGGGSLEGLLTQVADFAVMATPGADGAGVTMAEIDRTDTIVASAPFVSEVDGIQYRLGEGPCISAVSTGDIMTSGALGQDPSWPNFGPQAAALGVNSAISFPLIVEGKMLGSLNVYSHIVDAFGPSSQRIGERFAGPAAVAIHNAGILEQARRTATRLEAALVSRAVIDQAIGIIQSRIGITADDAFARLRIMSQREHKKLADVAANLVHEAVRRAQARNAERDS